MQSTVAHASPRVDVPRVRPSTAAMQERQLARFSKPYNQRVRVLCARHPRIADLAQSFPALLFALAAPRRNFVPEPVIQRVIDGARLAELSSLAGVPLWTRKLPPEAFDQPLPARLPDGALFRRQIANHLPKRRDAAKWLKAVADAADWGTEPLAVWVARELARNPRKFRHSALRRVALWAWYGTTVGTGRDGLPQKAWQPSMTFASAQTDAEDWLEQCVELQLFLGASPIEDMWLRSATVDGFAFVPLLTAAAIAEEAFAMSNCLRTYGDTVARNHGRLWSVRRDGTRVATLQIGCGHGDPWVRVHQLLGSSNSCPGKDVQWAARQWVEQHDVRGIEIKPVPWSAAFDRENWTAFWRPYWLAKRRIPDWLPIVHRRGVLSAI
jgi:hypothetical protein